MDRKWSGAPPSGSITCMLCRGSVPFAKSETHPFKSHLQHHHGVFYHHEVLISVNVLSQAYLIRIVEEYEKSGDKSEMVGEEDIEEIVELEETVETVSNSSVIFPSRQTNFETVKVHNCNLCAAKFEELRDLIEHVNEHKAQEKKEQEESEKRRQALEIERRRIIEEKKVIKQQKEMEKRRLEETTVKIQREILIKRQLEQTNLAFEEERKLNHEKALIGIDQSVKIQEQRRIIGTHVEDKTSPVVFECPECPYTAKRNIELKLHRLSHTGEKRFACDHCDEKFYLDRQLKRHALKHTQEFEKKFKLNQQIVGMDSSLPDKPQAVETSDLSLSSQLDRSSSKKKSKKLKVESPQDQIMNVLREDSNPEDHRLKARSSLGRISDIAANSEYFQKFPNQIKKGSTDDDRFSIQDQTMPEGWTYRELNSRPNGRIDKEYCSPDNMIFRSRRAMVEYMRTMCRYSQEEIERAEKGN